MSASREEAESAVAPLIESDEPQRKHSGPPDGCELSVLPIG